MDQMSWLVLDPLVMSRVIEDVLDMFVSVAELAVQYCGKVIIIGSNVKPSSSAHQPSLHVSASANHFYTLVMVDPNAPSPSEPTHREWLHWQEIDIPGGGYASEGMPYTGPQPPSGMNHRYVFVAFR